MCFPIFLQLYVNISKAPWFEWNPKLIADVIALLYKHEKFEEVETLNSEAIAKLEPRERELCSFHCNLIDSHSKHKSNEGVFDSYERLKQLQSHSSSIYVKKRAYESMISSLCAIDFPKEAENLMEEMKGIGIKLSVFEYRSVIYAYGRLGLFQEMKRIVGLMEGEGFELDVVCTNMVLSSLGTHGELTEMVSWVKKIKELGIPFSVRTYNSVLNSCPKIMSMVQDLKTFPLSLEELLENLLGDEAALVQELMGSSVLAEAMEWNSSELKLDLHGMHLGSAYLIMLQWFKELHLKFLAGNQVVPADIVVVCGSGKHSTVRGESPVKGLLREMIVRMKSPLRIDRKNIGCFIAKGKVVRNWLC